MRQQMGTALGAWCLMFGLACATSQVSSLPPVTQEPTQLVLPGKFVWADLVTDHVEDAKSFYGALFGWTFEDHDDDVVMVLRNGVRIGCVTRTGWPTSRWPTWTEPPHSCGSEAATSRGVRGTSPNAAGSRW